MDIDVFIYKRSKADREGKEQKYDRTKNAVEIK